MEEHNMDITPAVSHGNEPAVQTFIINGCKVNVRFAKESNPAAVSRIKEIMLSGISASKNTKICTN